MHINFLHSDTSARISRCIHFEWNECLNCRPFKLSLCICMLSVWTSGAPWINNKHCQAYTANFFFFFHFYHITWTWTFFRQACGEIKAREVFRSKLKKFQHRRWSINTWKPWIYITEGRNGEISRTWSPFFFSTFTVDIILWSVGSYFLFHHQTHQPNNRLKLLLVYEA